MPPVSDEKVNCRVEDCPDGSKQLIFTVAGTEKVVGEMRLSVDDERYLLVVSQLFSSYANMRRGRRVIPAAVHRIINGHGSH